MRRGWRAAALLGFGLMIGGCLELGGAWAITSSTTSTSTTSTSSSAATTTAASAALTGDTDDTGCSFFQCGDLMAADCNYWAQDCPEGDKCVPFPENGHSWTGEHRCSPVDPRPDAIGEPCTYEVTEWLWIDSCGADALCYAFASDEPGAGRCRPLCTYDDDQDYICPDGQLCVGIRESVNPVCLPMCDPVAQDCPEGDACRSVLLGYACTLDTSGDDGDYLDGCASPWHCSPGYECVPDVWLPECEHGDCCAPLCDVNVEGACPKGLDCIPYYEPGENPAYEHVGLCAVES